MEYVKRDLGEEIQKYMDAPEIIAVVGPRQAGKTTLLKEIESGLENSNFVSFEDRDVLRLFEEDEKEFAELHLEEYDYLLIDEFQYADEGGKKLKYLHDEYPEKKILITGSSAAEMTIQGLKHLTGRVLKFRLKPFSFREFLRYRDKKLFQLFREREEKLDGWIKGKEELDITDATLEKLEELRKEYAVYGGYPRVVLAESEEEKQKVLESIVETYLIREIGEVMGIEDDREMEDLMRVLALQMGEKTKYNSICQKAEITHQKLKDRLNVLEHTFVLKQVRPFYTNKQKEISKNPKIYFHDNGFRNALINSFQELELRKDQGELNENFFFTQSEKELKYWRTKSKAEVDFVKKNQDLNAYEVKTAPKTTRSMRSFQKKYEPEKMFVMNQEKMERTETEVFLPLIFSHQATKV
ncbi:MAG: ATP-binding protein [Candidatus Nanohaloarchaea archaeon]